MYIAWVYKKGSEEEAMCIVRKYVAAGVHSDQIHHGARTIRACNKTMWHTS